MNRHRRFTSVLCISFVLITFLSGFFLLRLRRANAQAARPVDQTRAKVSLHAAQRGHPWINLRDGHDVPTAYTATSGLAQNLEPHLARPLTLASGDFDGDGVLDLVSGYVGFNGGMLGLHRGNIDSLFPNLPEARQRRQQPVSASTDAALGDDSPAPFLSRAQVFEVPEAPEFLGTGDFDGDGHWDVIAAARGSEALYLLPGDGRGGFGQAQRRELPGRVTALASGEINRADGLMDVVVGIVGKDGPQVLVFESPEGAFRAKPEAFALPAAATALALGQLDGDNPTDLAVAAGRELVIVHGRDRKLSLDGSKQAEVPPATISQQAFSFAITAVVIGDFTGNHQTDTALLSADGTVHVLERGVTAQRAPAGKAGLRESIAVTVPSFQLSGLTASPSLLVPARVSSRPGTDLIVVDAVNHQLHIIEGGMLAQAQQSDDAQRAMSEAVVTLDVEGEPVAVLPMRLNADALSDLVVLKGGREASLAVALTAAVATFTVNSTADTDDSNLMDGVCADMTGACTLRAAMQQANFSVGADTINFSIGSGVKTINVGSTGLGPLPTLSEAVTIDGTTQPGFAGTPLIELNGSLAGAGVSGLKIGGGNSVVRGLAIYFFNGHGIWLAPRNGGETIEGNFIGTDAGGVADLGNALNGVYILDVSDNLIGGTTAAARNIILGNDQDGVHIFDSDDPLSGAATMNLVRGNYIGTDVTGTLDRGNTLAGVRINSAAFNDIGGLAGNVIAGNDGDGVLIINNGAKGNLVRGNFIGTDKNGTAALGNSGDGVSILDAPSNTIGSPVFSNIISRNNGHGVEIVGNGATGNEVQGNFIGTDLAGNAGLGNAKDGVRISGGASTNTIGGATAGTRNLISGNNRNGVEIFGGSAMGNAVQGNFIGTNAAGAAALGNTQDGVLIDNAPGNTIGGAMAGTRNLISSNHTHGIEMVSNGAKGNLVQGNFIGTDLAGNADLGNTLDGLHITDAPSNTIGGMTATPGTPPGNLISGNDSDGIEISESGGGQAMGNLVQGNCIGTNAAGTAALGNSLDGVRLLASNNTLGGGAAGARNLISGNNGNGVQIFADSSTVQGNFIGTNAAGTGALSNNLDGVRIFLGDNNTIGGMTAMPGAPPGNLISGNLSHGIELSGGAGMGNQAQGNLIGTNLSGNIALGNSLDGVFIKDTSNSTIGGAMAKARNIISGNGAHGVEISSGLGFATGNQVQGNFIGTNAAGNAALGNSLDGVHISNASSNTIGGTQVPPDPGTPPGNLISGNGSDGVEINGAGAPGNRVRGNLIGTNAAGAAALGNSLDGVRIIGGDSNTIGGAVVGAGNIISGNGAHGVEISGSSLVGHRVQNNNIGTNAADTAALGNNGDGVFINGTPNNLIGGAAILAINVISGNNGHGVEISGSSAMGNLVQGNFIGTDLGGGVARGNHGDGVRINGAPNSTIGGTASPPGTPPGNVILGNGSDGVEISGSGATGTNVQGNCIGTNGAGQADRGNSANGVLINGAPGNTVGGGMPGEGNLISGNDSDGVEISGSNASNNIVLGNFIGTNVTGDAPLGNTLDGLFINGAPRNRIGGAALVGRNIISGNGSNGIEIFDLGARENVVRGNYIGTDANGTANLGNGSDGVRITSAPSNTIGGTAAGAGNVISGNSNGIELSSATGNVVQGNFIGTNAAGTAAVGNDGDGVSLIGAFVNTIGGTTAEARNVISGNHTNGIKISGSGATVNCVQGNFIGTQMNGTSPLGNASHGVFITSSASNNTIGGTASGAGNTSAFNGGDGVFADSGTGNAILRNAIFSNAGLGIDLGPDGVTPNDACDGDTGANNLQNFPVLTSALSSSAGTNIQGALNSKANTIFKLQFFSSTTCDPSGFGEGQNFMGSMVVMTDGSCSANFSMTFAAGSLAGQFVTATATDPTDNTSEFSQCLQVTAAACTFPLSPVDQSFTSNSGTGSVNVTAPSGCSWTAGSNAGFVTISPSGSGSGNGTVNYSVAANTNTTARTGMLTIAGQTFTVLQGAQFLDVPPSDQFFTEIGKISARGVTVGCGGGNYCPDAFVTREQMAVLIEKALGVLNPPTPAQPRFMDVPSSRFGYAFIDDFARRGITVGCGGGNYCPDALVTREQMAAFLIRALCVFNPPTPPSPRFADVPASNPFYAFIEEMAVRQITQGCGGGNYCPNGNVTRAQMAAFLVRAFGA